MEHTDFLAADTSNIPDSQYTSPYLMKIASNKKVDIVLIRRIDFILVNIYIYIYIFSILDIAFYATWNNILTQLRSLTHLRVLSYLPLFSCILMSSSNPQSTFVSDSIWIQSDIAWKIKYKFRSVLVAKQWLMDWSHWIRADQWKIGGSENWDCGERKRKKKERKRESARKKGREDKVVQVRREKSDFIPVSADARLWRKLEDHDGGRAQRKCKSQTFPTLFHLRVTFGRRVRLVT